MITSSTNKEVDTMPPEKQGSLLDDLSLWLEQGIISLFYDGTVDPDKSYIFLDFNTVPQEVLHKRVEMIRASEVGKVPSWYFIVPAIHEEQRRELEERYWVTICDGISTQEITKRFVAR